MHSRRNRDRRRDDNTFSILFDDRPSNESRSLGNGIDARMDENGRIVSIRVDRQRLAGDSLRMGRYHVDSDCFHLSVLDDETCIHTIDEVQGLNLFVKRDDRDRVIGWLFQRAKQMIARRIVVSECE